MLYYLLPSPNLTLEVKGGADKSAPSFKAYTKNRQPEIALRFSKMGYRQDGTIRNIPLYLAAKTVNLLQGRGL